MNWLKRPLKIINLSYFFTEKGCNSDILFFTFAPMNKNQNTGKYSYFESENKRSRNGLWQNFFNAKRALNFDTFQYFMIYHTKFQIIYENIRVWKLD